MEFKTWSLDIALDSWGNNEFVFHQILVKFFYLSLLSFSLAFYNSVKKALFGTLVLCFIFSNRSCSIMFLGTLIVCMMNSNFNDNAEMMSEKKLHFLSG